MNYYCKECKLAVVVTPGETIKACTCDAPIVAEMVGKASGKATVSL